MKLSKLYFLQQKTSFLGHVIDASGIHISQGKIKTIIDYLLSTSVDQVHSFLGIVGYNRRFIKGYAIIASPLLLKQDVSFKNSPLNKNKVFTTL